MSDRRQERVADLIRDEVSLIIQQEMGDPRLGMVSVTQVEMSPDLKYARLFVSVYAPEPEQRDALVALNNASGFIRHTLAQRVRMRTVPELSFRLDGSMAHAESIARILRELEPELAASSEGDEKPGTDEAGSA
ncbi:MAG TPA: 30S ribosome-binding factor RbfA [Chloroflexi bacterium]|nr:30S ribosome-binding factor RbfA [Chloroflexota bacterium]HRA32324.1 30S ribosome-binding factor RbfA [Thermomicrobiales bacterium]